MMPLADKMPIWYGPDMKLSTFLSERKISTADFAAKIGLSEVSITRYAASTRIPRRQHMLAIAEATEGLVTANDFFGIEVPAAPDASEAA